MRPIPTSQWPLILAVLGFVLALAAVGTYWLSAADGDQRHEHRHHRQNEPGDESEDEHEGEGEHEDGNDRQAVQTSPLTPAEVQQASALYAKTCAACHGARLEGAVGPSLVGVGSRYSLAKIEQIAQRGKGKKKAVSMPPGLATAKEASLLGRWLVAGPRFVANQTSPDKP